MLPFQVSCAHSITPDFPKFTIQSPQHDITLNSVRKSTNVNNNYVSGNQFHIILGHQTCCVRLLGLTERKTTTAFLTTIWVVGRSLEGNLTTVSEKAPSYGIFARVALTFPLCY